ncbi:hypothetical protein [Phenylobacterium sp.]|uniref:hypothetical protein n=1 Tax=Phenylobacterium sp. TaxID=1871053 RepID=UPI002869F8D7|nr:hypothetical protein [Phenylobacterium sp.]
MFGIGKLMGGALLSPAILEALGKVPMADSRKAFIAVLVATASSAGSKPNFNLELEMNDLWTRLQNLKTAAGPSSGGVGGIMAGALGPLQNMLGGALKAITDNTSR